MIPLPTCLGPALASRADPSSVQEDSKYSANSANSANPRLPELFCLRSHLWAMDSSLSYSQGFPLIDNSMSVSVHSLPLFFSRKGLCPLLPVPLPSGIAPPCLLRALAQPFGSVAAPCSPHYLPCWACTSHSPTLSGCLPPVICCQ